MRNPRLRRARPPRNRRARACGGWELRRFLLRAFIRFLAVASRRELNFGSARRRVAAATQPDTEPEGESEHRRPNGEEEWDRPLRRIANQGQADGDGKEVAAHETGEADRGDKQAAPAVWHGRTAILTALRARDVRIRCVR